MQELLPVRMTWLTDLIRQVLICCCVMPFGANIIWAQSDSVALRAEELVRSVQDSQPEILTQQRDFISNLRTFAIEAEKKGRSDYVTALRFGLRHAVRGRVASTDLRHSSELRNISITRASLEKSPLDQDAQLRRNFDQLLSDVESGLRVVGGVRVPEGRFKHTVAIRRYVGGRGQGLCTGVLFRRNAILTAAHCVCDLKLNRQPAFGDFLRVVTGNVVPGRITSQTADTYEIEPAKTKLFKSSFCSEYFSNTKSWYGHDLAVLFTKDELPADVEVAKITPIELYLSRTITALTIVGFGDTQRSDVSLFNAPKFFASVPIASKLCDISARGGRLYRDCIPGREMVLADWYFRRHDTCAGDSGGPAYVQEAQNYFVVAITSRALDLRGTCGPGGIYSLISPRVIAWLDEVVPASKPGGNP